MEFGLKQVADRFELSRQAWFELVRDLVCSLDSVLEFAKFHYAVQLASWRPARDLDSVMEFGLLQ